MLDDATRRALRFSLFLQVFAAVMMSVALIVRAATTGWDGITGVLALAVAIILSAVVWTSRRLRAG